MCKANFLVYKIKPQTTIANSATPSIKAADIIIVVLISELADGCRAIPSNEPLPIYPIPIPAPITAIPTPNAAPRTPIELDASNNNANKLI